MAAALLLHRDGHRVTVFERFDAPAPIGSGLMLQPTGLAVLRALGLESQALQSGARIERLFGQAGASGRTVLDVRYASLGKQGLFALGVHRASLFDILHGAVAEARIEVVTGHEITGCTTSTDGRRSLVLANGRAAGPFDLVVDALGTRTPLTTHPGRPLAYGALWASLNWVDAAGLDPLALSQRYRAASTMIGVMPAGRTGASERTQAAFFWSLRADRLADWRTAGLDAWKADALGLWPALAPYLDQIASTDQLSFAQYAHRTLVAPAEPGLIHIGDAWHSTSPQLGQGANMALLDAWALSVALRGDGGVAEALARSVALRRGHVRLYQTLSALLTPVYQSDGRIIPFLRDWGVGPMSKLWPVGAIQAAMVSGLIGAPLSRLGLATKGT
jgi:2-polyprenyl-6-methoxyphenol hydroxylase-like FAD-dependent oxidoreductase